MMGRMAVVVAAVVVVVVVVVAEEEEEEARWAHLIIRTWGTPRLGSIRVSLSPETVLFLIYFLHGIHREGRWMLWVLHTHVSLARTGYLVITTGC